jgi:23S rRNA pseudouridine2605 synthase
VVHLSSASEGLLLLTNDGGFANLLMKAASHVPKTYMVKVAGKPNDEGLRKLRAGLLIGSESGRRVKTAPARVNLIREANNPWYEITLTEGKNRQIRRMFEEIGHHVEKIKRVRYGNLELDVHPGKFRRLTPDEVERLKSITKPGADPARFIPVHPKPKVTFAKTKPVNPRFIPRPLVERPSVLAKPHLAFAKTENKPVGPKFIKRSSASRPSAPAGASRPFARTGARPTGSGFGRRASGTAGSTTASDGSSFIKTSSKPNRPKFPAPSSAKRAPAASRFRPGSSAERPPSRRPSLPTGLRRTNQRRSPKASS